MQTPRYLAAAVAALVLVAGCDSTDAERTAPPLIAPASFDFDASFPEAAGAGANWTNAALRVGIVSVAVGAHLVIPSVATHAATQAEPTVVNGTWIWENTVPINNTPVTFRLEGTPAGQEIDWSMFISSSQLIAGAAYDGFELYDGTTTLDGRTGRWQLYYLIEDARTHVLTADFDVESDQFAEVTYSIPESNPNPDARGSSVLCRKAADVRLFDWHQEPEDFDHAVDWSASTHAGSIAATNYNGGVRACWNGGLEDVPCDPAAVAGPGR